MKNKKFSFNPYAHFTQPNFKFAQKGKWYTIIPLAIILIGVFVISVWGLNLGLDFTGGTIIKVDGIANATEYDTIKDKTEQVLGDNDVTTTQFQRVDSNSGGISLEVRYQNVSGIADMAAHNTAILTELKSAIGSGYNVEISTISASTSGENLFNTFMVIIGALLGMMLYMLIRFKTTSGIACFIALFHDILVMVAFVAIFRIQINASFIAAAVTVVGYSINNTLVLFDRIRENEKHNNMNESVEMLTDRSVRETFNRQMNTVLTTLIPVFVLCIAGVSLIREFALPIMFGLLAGIPGTLFITTSLYVRFEKSKAVAKKLKENKLLKTANKTID